MRLYVGLALLSALLATIAVLGGRRAVGPAEQGLPPKREVNRIAYVGLDARIRTIRPDGTDERQVSPAEGFFTWPTWSPDARRLAFSGVVRDATGNPRIGLYALHTTRGQKEEVHLGEPGFAGLLAAGVLHYTLWSPDSRQLAFVVVMPGPGGLTLFVDDLRDGVAARFVLDQAPLWMSWSPDSRYLLVHRTFDHFLVNTLQGVKVTRLDFTSLGYRVPAWDPREGTVTLASEDGSGRFQIYATGIAGGGTASPQPLLEVSPEADFLWSPAGDFLAVADSGQVLDYLGTLLLVHPRLSLLPRHTADPIVEIEDNVLAYFWSPDGTKLAYVTPSDRRGSLRWMIWDVRERRGWPLADFIPSRDQLVMFQFFDQYAYSHSLWSPDSKSLVFAGTLSGGAVTASLTAHPGHDEPHVIVVDVPPGSLPNTIADGVMAFWSPR